MKIIKNDGVGTTLGAEIDKINENFNKVAKIAGVASVSNFEAHVNTPTFNFNTTVPNKLFIQFTQNLSQSIQIKDILTLGKNYTLYITYKLNSGISDPVILGLFTSSENEGRVIVHPTTEEQTAKLEFTATSTYFSIGLHAANNRGGAYEFANIEIYQGDELLFFVRKGIEDKTVIADTFFTEQFLQSLSRYDKPLTKIAVAGDSLMANAIGGSIPAEFDEGSGYQPMRLRVNSIPRRIYDLLSWNKATHIRLDAAEWTKSGTWSTVGANTVFEGLQDSIFRNTEATAYAEITVPAGNENFALALHKDAGFGTLNVTINGGDISAYGNATISLARTKDTVNDFGNPYYTELYTGLPAGANVIRITKDGTTNPVQLWGGFYWTGNTLVLHNIAHGGHTLGTLITDHLNAELLENDFDAILFQLPIMNECSKSSTVIKAVEDIQTIINDYATGKDIAFMTCNPFGDNGAGTNYYTTYPDPSMQDFATGLKERVYENALPFVDVFEFFKKKIENRGGTLEGGEGGLYYTDDGQHPNEDGCREWFNLIRFLFENKPIRYI